MPIATMRSPRVTGMLRSNTGGIFGSEASGIVNTVSVNGMLFRRKTTMLKNANGSSRRGKAMRYMGSASFARACRSQSLAGGARSGLFLRLEDLAAAVHAGLEIDVMRPAQLAGILVLDIGRLLQRIRG